MDFNSLTGSITTAGSIANWLNSATLQASASTIVAEAESQIYRRLRHWKMLTSTTGTLTLNADSLTLPTDYLEDKLLRITGIYARRLTRRTLEEVIGQYAYDGTGARVSSMPNIYFNDQSSIKFDNPADQAYPYLLYYYQQPAALSSGNATNFLTTLYPRLMRCACMLAASEFMKDSGTGNYDRTYWVQMAQDEIVVAQAESDHSQRSMEVGAILI